MGSVAVRRVVALIVAVGALAIHAAEDAPLGVPDEAAIARAKQLIRKTFAVEYGQATTPPARAALARRLLKEAVETTEDAACRYVLLTESRDLAAKSADAGTACRA